MATLDGYPLPRTAQHDEDGNHVPPSIPGWRQAADPESPHYDPNRTLRGSEVELNERRARQFHEHLQEHRRRGEPALTVEEV